jgi:signal transduction histidine kinase
VTRSLQSRVLALAGLGVFAAATTLTLLSRQSLLAIEAAAERTTTRTTPFGARVVGRDMLTDREAFEALAGSVAAETAAFRRRSLWLAPGLTAVSLLLAWGVVTSVRRPVRTLTDAAERIAGGDLSQPIQSDVDEIGRLGAALEHMRVQLRDSIASVEYANGVLEQRVAERTRQLSRVLRRVISAQEDERRRVARELHDETSQLVAAMAMSIDAAKGAPAPAAVADLRLLIDRMHDSLHRIIVNLRPSVLDDLGLAAAIEWLAEHQLRRSGIAVRCELADLQDCRVDTAIEIALFRVVQESMTNIVRHASASAVLVQGGVAQRRPAASDDRLWIEIEDDGEGFDPAAIAAETGSLRGIGVAGMRERMELVGGTIEIESAPGEGTRIRLEAPVEVAAEAFS